MRATENLGHLLGRGDQVRVADQRMTVVHFDSDLLLLTVDQPYLGASQLSAPLFRRPRQVLVPSQSLFFHAQNVSGSPLRLSIP